MTHFRQAAENGTESVLKHVADAFHNSGFPGYKKRMNAVFSKIGRHHADAGKGGLLAVEPAMHLDGQPERLIGGFLAEQPAAGQSRLFPLLNVCAGMALLHDALCA